MGREIGERPDLDRGDWVVVDEGPHIRPWVGRVQDVKPGGTAWWVSVVRADDGLTRVVQAHVVEKEEDVTDEIEELED